MPIYSRFTNEMVPVTITSDSVKLPLRLSRLFEQVLPMGAVIDRKSFHKTYLPKYESMTMEIKGQQFSVRPAWTDYKPSPQSHLIVIGHILFCHVNVELNWFYQPSTRLFSEDPKIRLRQFKSLLDRAASGKMFDYTIGRKKVTA